MCKKTLLILFIDVSIKVSTSTQDFQIFKGNRKVFNQNKSLKSLWKLKAPPESFGHRTCLFPNISEVSTVVDI
jgi:hypothetical protein